MVVPLLSRGRALGTLTLVSAESGHRFDGTELALAEEIGRRAGVAVENAGLVERITRLNRELEERVRRRTEELERANRELEAFSYSVSHDLRAPLRAINGFANLLQEEHAERLDEEGRRLLAVVRENAAQMDLLIKDLLAFSRLGRTALRPGRVDMSHQCRDVFLLLRQEEPERRVHLRLQDLPPAEADPALVRQVLSNLLQNALKFTRHRQEAVIEVGGCEDGERSLYYVRDNGAGFDTRYADRLFTIFQRLHRAEEYPGTGVGLALVKRIIERHGGGIWAEAQVDRGATFFFTLPRAGAGAGNPADPRAEEGA